MTPTPPAAVPVKGAAKRMIGELRALLKYASECHAKGCHWVGQPSERGEDGECPKCFDRDHVFPRDGIDRDLAKLLAKYDAATPEATTLAKETP